MSFLRRLCLLAIVLIPVVVVAQKKSYLGINVTPLIINTLDIRYEHQIGRNFAFQAGAGARLQNRDSSGIPPFGFLKNFVEMHNYGAYLSVGGRIFDRNSTEYPYLALDVIGTYFDETIQGDDGNGGIAIWDANGVKMGGSITVGFVTELLSRVHMDVALQFGYTPPRKDLNAYYLPGFGYSTYGLGIIGVKGGHLQPIVNLKYDLFKDPRQRIREME